MELELVDTQARAESTVSKPFPQLNTRCHLLSLIPLSLEKLLGEKVLILLIVKLMSTINSSSVSLSLTCLLSYLFYF